MRLISDADVSDVITMREAIDAMAAAFEQFGNGAGAVAPRVRATAEHRQQSAAVSMMGASLPAAGVLGAKVYSTIGGRFSFVIVLFSSVTGKPLAAIEGTGVQARAHAEALLLTHPFERVLVVGRATAPEFADWVQTEFGVAASAVDAPTAAREADVIVTATRATEPLFDGALVKRGAFVAAVGSSKPAARELDDALLTRAELIVVEWLPAAQTEAGEFVRAASGVIDSTRVTELGKLLVRGTTYDRRSGDIVVYKSVGIGLEDVALAHLVYERCS
ncbi:MAG: ornithine cyclodeaminase [Burkholderiaceae bacterium]|nr:ornithine cyclodeaminase [Burkholderiaceae bacterium]